MKELFVLFFAVLHHCVASVHHPTDWRNPRVCVQGQGPCHSEPRYDGCHQGVRPIIRKERSCHKGLG